MYQVATSLEALLERLPPGLARLVSEAGERTLSN